MNSNNSNEIPSVSQVKPNPSWLRSGIQRLKTTLKHKKQNSSFLRGLLKGTTNALKTFSLFKVHVERNERDTKGEPSSSKDHTKLQSYEKNKECSFISEEVTVAEDNSKEINYVWSWSSLEETDDYESSSINSECDLTNWDIINAGEVVQQNSSSWSSDGSINTGAESNTSQICLSCFQRHPTLPVSSSSQCQEKGPVLTLCMKFHKKQPVVHNPGNGHNDLQVLEIFKNREGASEKESNICQGNTPKLNHCPMCSSISLEMGDCSCNDCYKIQQIVELLQGNKNTIIEMCPCYLCSHLRPRVKVCKNCRNAYLKKAKPYYLALSF